MLRLKRAAGMESSDFLEQHTLCPQVCDQKFPVVILKMEEEDKRCPFISEKGCGVYNDRPWACRMYPLGAAEPKSHPQRPAVSLRAPGGPVPRPRQRARRSRCANGSGRQGAEAYEMMSGGFKELTLHDFWDSDKPLTRAAGGHVLHGLLRPRPLPPLRIRNRASCNCSRSTKRASKRSRTDDQELLEFGMQWLRFSIFGERSMRLQPGRSAKEERRMTPVPSKPVLVIGGGIAGLTAAVELADAGCERRFWWRNRPAWAAGWRACISISPSSARPPAGWKCTIAACAIATAITVLTLAEVVEIGGCGPATIEVTVQDSAAFRDRVLHPLRRLRGRVPGRAARRIQSTG